MVAVPIGINICILMLSISLGYIEGRRLVARLPELTLQTLLSQVRYLKIGLPLFMIALVAIQGTLFQPSVAWQLPLAIAYSQTAIAWAILQLVLTWVFSTVVTIAYLTHAPSRLGYIMMGTLVVIIIQSIQWGLTRPVAPHLTHVVTPDGVILQSSGESCAAATGANIVNALGLSATEPDMARLFGTARGQGTSAAQVIRDMRQLGIVTEKHSLAHGSPQGLPAPAMLFVDHPDVGPEAHAVAFMGMSQGQAEIWDPLVGQLFLSPASLQAIWPGRALTFRLQKPK